VGQPGDLLGVLETPVFTAETVELAPGGIVCFFTDGVTEGRRGAEWYGDERLQRHLVARRQEDATTIAETLIDDVVTFQAGRTRDDIAVVVLKAPAN
jgi:sigma-B regulation protein RsbU (phosphoserine phosphatase)